MKITQFMQKNILLFDGAMGTMLQQQGLSAGEIPELYNLTQPSVVREIHKAYVAAGADVITTNTFQANRLKIQLPHSIEEIVQAGVTLAKESGAPYVALDIGPLGQLYPPVGDCTFTMAYEHFKRQMVAGATAGADCIIIETFGNLYEAKIAILAAKENTNLPVFCTLTFEKNQRTYMGADPLTALFSLQDLGVAALGANCSLGPEEMLPVIANMAKHTRVPLMVQANAGLPSVVDGHTSYCMQPKDFTEYASKMLALGVAVLGGCCGTTPEFTARLDALRQGKAPIKPQAVPVTVATSGRQTVLLNTPVTVVGERINPSGKPELSQALKEENFELVIDDILQQVEEGAEILDINLAVPMLDESALFVSLLPEIQSVCAAPLQLDSAQPEALAAGARVYQGKPILNSLNGTKASMEAVFPIVKQYGTTVIGLTFDEKGIPETADRLFSIAEKIVTTAADYNIPKEDIIIDCLVLPQFTHPDPTETLTALQRITNELGVVTTLGISNRSFGLGDREAINAAFLEQALKHGLHLPIVNPASPSVMSVIKSYTKKA